MLQGKSALITGGATGIGKAIVELFAKNHAKIALNYRSSEESARKIEEELKNIGADVFLIKGDIINKEDCKKIVEETVKHFGSLDILINNAGMGLERESILDITDDEFNKIIDTNLKGTYHMSVNALKVMEKQENGGSIVSISTSAVAQPSSGNGPYAMSKTGVELLMRSIAQNHGVNKVRCNIVAPGPTKTQMFESYFDEEKKNRVVNEIPLRRFGDTMEVANACLFFASDMSSYVTGQKIHVDGGRTIR